MPPENINKIPWPKNPIYSTFSTDLCAQLPVPVNKCNGKFFVGKESQVLQTFVCIDIPYELCLLRITAHDIPPC